MRRTIVVCTLVLSCSVLIAAQKQKARPCKKCQDEAAQLVEKMKAANITLKSAVEAAEARCKGDAVAADVEWSEDRQQPFFAVYCSPKSGGLQVVEINHEGKPVGMEAAINLPAIHDEEAHKPPPPKPGA